MNIIIKSFTSISVSLLFTLALLLLYLIEELDRELNTRHIFHRKLHIFFLYRVHQRILLQGK